MNKFAALRRVYPTTRISLAASLTMMTGGIYFSSPQSSSRPTENENIASYGTPNNDNSRRQPPPNSSSSSSSSSSESPNHHNHLLNRPKILFLGSGSSTGCPKPICALAFPEEKDETDGIGSSESNDDMLDNKDDTYRTSCSCRSTPTTHLDNIIPDPALVELQRQMGTSRCAVSKQAAWGDPRTNKNYRNNPSLLLSHRNNDDADDVTDDESSSSLPPIRNVVIDVGKTFRETAIRWMPINKIHSLDAIVLTHAHMDAIGGLDDVRGFQMFNPATMLYPSTPVYLSQDCLDGVKQHYGYLVPQDSVKSNVEVGDISLIEDKKPKVKRHVAALTYSVIEPFKPFVAAGLRMVPLPVMHGEDMVCMGFAFTLRGITVAETKKADANENENKNDSKGTTITIPAKDCLNVVYLSDISRMLPETQEYILNTLPPIDVLVIDSLLESRSHFSHFSLKQAINLAKTLKPKRTFIVGMNCDGFRPHDEMNEELKKIEGLEHVQLAHDGLTIEVP